MTKKTSTNIWPMLSFIVNLIRLIVSIIVSLLRNN